MRVAKALTEPNWGSQFTPRIGTEVVVPKATPLLRTYARLRRAVGWPALGKTRPRLAVLAVTGIKPGRKFATCARCHEVALGTNCPVAG